MISEDDYNALLAEVYVQTDDELWQPMETAPLNFPILGKLADGKELPLKWSFKFNEWLGPYADFYRPVSWRPLPSKRGGV
jgi:hypothetical protein